MAINLLQDIQACAVNGDSDLETLLRKCRVLASRLQHDDFKNWVTWELDGYSDLSLVPAYRIFECQASGHFSGPLHSEMRNMPIPEATIPEQYREQLTKVKFLEGVGALKKLVDSTQSISLQRTWPANTHILFGSHIFESMVMMQAWNSIPVSNIVGILSTVRNRILSFALEIESKNPDAGEAIPSQLPVPKETVTQIFNQNISGNIGNVAAGSHIQQASTLNITQGNIQTLRDYLKQQGVNEEEIDHLEVAIREDGNLKGNAFGQKVAVWMGKMIQKAASGTWKMATDVGAKLLTEALKHYYGI